MWGCRTRRKPPNRPSRWRLCVRALAKQCFASKAPSPLGARWRHPWRQRSCSPTPPHLRQIPAAVGMCRPWSTRSIHAMRGCFLFNSRNIRFRWRFMRAWRGSTTDRRTLSKAGGSGCGGVSRMGPRHASGGLGRTPNPGLAVCAGQRTRASGDRAYMGEGALLAKHCFASARTHSRQRLGRAPEGYLQRPPPPDPPRHPTECTLLLLPWRLPASGRHYRRCRAQPGRTPPTGSRRPERVPYAAIR